MSGRQEWPEPAGERPGSPPGFYDHERAPGRHYREGGLHGNEHGPDDHYDLYDDEYDRYDDEYDDYGEQYDGYEDSEGDHPGPGAGFVGGEGDWPVVGTRRGGGGPPPRADRSRRRSGHRVLKGLAIATALVVILAAAGLVWAQSQINPGGHRGPAVTVVIPSGSSTTAIGQRLVAAGVVHDATLFALYVRLHGYGPLYPGTYQLQKNSPYSAAISALRAGPKVLTENLVIPEGYTVAQIARAVGGLPHLGLSAQKFLAAADTGAVRSPYEPAGVNNLEGLLFPATYQVSQGETEVDILEEMVGTFDERVQSIGLTAAAAKLGLTPYQVITVASIVEREAKLAGDRPDVASAIYNRLRIGMKLGADSTQTYYLRLTNPAIEPTATQLDQPSPYNTRTNAGLPPTPIADPGLASLEAAANPPSTTYLYFVEINPDGQLGFASTDAGFQHLRQQCQAAGLC